MKGIIRHTGVVERVVGERVTVRIRQREACSACSAAGLCKSSDAKEKLIDITTPLAPTLSVGQEVSIEGSTRQGLKATLWAYIVPLALIVGSLVVNAYIMSEAWAAVVALAVAALYYLALYALRHKLEGEFTFTIQ